MMSTTDPPTTRELLTPGQRDAIAGLIRSFRRNGTNGPDWDMAGIHAGIRRAEQSADSGVQLAAAALAAAANPAVRTPGWIARPGRHWPDLGDGARRQPTRLTTDLPCPDHDGHTVPCPACRAQSRPGTPDEIAALRAAARARSEKADEHRRDVDGRDPAVGRSAGR